MRRPRNRGCVPYLGTEGIFIKPLPPPDVDYSIRAFDRLHSHQTMSSARRHAHFRPFTGLIPLDQLDFVLGSSYDHSSEIFPEVCDCYLQLETLGKDTWRRLRNVEGPAVKRAASDYLMELVGDGHIKGTPYRYNTAHPVLISGIVEKKHPHNVSLMNSSHHLPQSNAGYSRQTSDGNVYQY